MGKEDLTSLQRRLAQARENLRLIQERKEEFVLSTDVPLQLVKEEEKLVGKIAELEREIAARSGRALPPDEAGDYVEPRSTGSTYHVHIDNASALAIGDGAQVVQGGQSPNAPVESGSAAMHPAGEPVKAAPPGDFLYDAFISYSSKNGDWVRQTLLPRLEREGLRICIDFRDFEIGAPSLVNMENAVERSRKTLLVLTPAWVASQWTDFEALLVGTEDPAGRARRILPLMVERCEKLPGRLKIFTYLDLTKPAEFETQMRRLVAAIRSTAP